jgi:hypothetical protein
MWSRIRRIFFRPAADPETGFPPGWTKTAMEVARASANPDLKELEWACAYERFHLRPWRFPRDGDVYEALEDIGVSFLTHWRAPFTGGGEGILRKGEQVRVLVYGNDPEPIRVYARPVNYTQLESELVSQKERNDSQYSGFTLSIPSKDLKFHFKLSSSDTLMSDQFGLPTA